MTLVAAESAVEVLLRELVVEVRGMRADLQRGSRQVQTSMNLSRADLELLGRLLPAVAGAYGAEKFSSRDLAEDSRPAVRLVVRGLSVKAISKLFARAAGTPIDGLMVLRCDFEFGVRTWQIVAC